jgi:hypothetical protein
MCIGVAEHAQRYAQYAIHQPSKHAL